MTTDGGIRRSTLRHFLPGMALFWLGALLVSRELPLWQGMALLAAETVAMGVGYHLTLKLGRKRLRPLSRVRAFAAGLTTPLLAAVGFMFARPLGLIDGLPSIVAVALAGSLAAGGFLAATMFVRKRRPELPEPTVAGELPGESLEAWFARVESQAEELVQRLKTAVTTIVTTRISAWEHPQ